VVINPNRQQTQQAVHKAYMRLACLELERTRYQRERTIVQARLQALDDRLAAIDAEQVLLRGQTPGVAAAPAIAAAAAPLQAADARTPEKKEEAPRGSGFSFRY
jgi:chromosome segregation ATPase